MANTRRIAIEPDAADAGAVPLTEAQSGLWYAQRLDPASPTLNTGQYIDIRGPLDIRVFRRAVDQMVAETDALALRFFEALDGPRQIVDASLRPWLETVDLTGDTDPLACAIDAMRADSAGPVDLERGPVAVFRLFILGPDRCLWYERIHHLAIDGYGMVLITNRVAELYSAAVGGVAAGAALAPLGLSFDEDAAYRGSDRRATDQAYWREVLSDLPEMAGMAAGRAVSAHDFHRETLHVDAGLAARLHERAEACKTTWPDVLVGLVAAYCRRFTGAPEIVVGVPHMGRLGSRAARVPCMVMNVLPLRVMRPEDEDLPDYLQRITRQLVRARRHGRYRSEQMRRDLGLVGGQRRLYGPIVNVQPFDMPPRFKGLEARLNILGAGSVDDITFTFRGDARQHLTLEVDANPNLYSFEATSAHGRRLMAFLDAAIDTRSLAEVPTASPEEAERFVFEVNQTAHAVRDTTLTTLIEETMQRTPEAPALVFEGEVLTYSEIERRSAALAAHLVRLGAGRETIVAVALPRSLELVIALVATLRAGAAYLPLDLDHPKERLARILVSAQPVCVLAEAGDAHLFENVPVVSAWPEDGAAPTISVQPDDMAYVIYTSGSTGEPKGVVIEHRAIVNRLEWMREHYGFGPQDRILQKTPAPFDVSVWEFFLPLITGATLVLAAPGAHRDPSAIAALIREQAITTLHFVPSMLSAFLASPASQGLSLKRIFCSGEELSADLRDRFHATMTSELHNLYGPTEAAVDVSFWPAGPDDRSMPVPIGFPVWNTRLYVLDEFMLPVPAGVVAHLYLAGVQLAGGYLGRPDLTGERFVADPFVPGERMYRTGDVARFREDGAVVFLGRSDDQVKIRGVRIELGEIEASILSSGLVQQAGVIVREDRVGDRRIVAAVVPGPGYNEEALRTFLASRLTDYMIPSAFPTLDALPVTANGKLDRAAFPTPEFSTGQGRSPATETETVLAGLFAEILGLPGPVGADDDFFRNGGDSLLAVHLMLRVGERFGRDPGLGALFDHPTVAALAALLEADAGVYDSGLNPLIRLRTGNEDRAPLFIVHPAGGLAWGYRHLARAMSGDRSIYGLQSPALDPAYPLPESLDALAADYVARIVKLSPKGPYHLAGWSVGGIIAQAMALHLRALGKTVGLVALLDSYPSECWRAEPEPDETAAMRALLAIAGYDPGNHPELVTRDAIVGFLRNGGSPLGGLPAAALDGVVRVVLDTNRLVRGHHHAFFDGTLTHVRAALDHQGKKLTPDLWMPHAAALDRIDVPFLHPQLATPQAAALIGPEIDRRLRAFDETTEGN